MTTTQRERIRDLYKQGHGYKSIAKELGISVGSVRNALSSAGPEAVCRQCGRKLTFIEGKKKKTFCCDACRYAYWNSRRRESKNDGK